MANLKSKMSKEVVLPDRAEIQAVLKKLAKDKTAYSYVLPSNAGPIEKAKYDVCEKILRYKRQKDLTQRQVASLIGIPETRVSEILHYKIWKFSLDRLLEYYQKVNPKMVLRVA